MNDWDDDPLDDDVFDATDELADDAALNGYALDAFDDEQPDDEQPDDDELDRDFESIFAAAAVNETSAIAVVEAEAVVGLSLIHISEPTRPH